MLKMLSLPRFRGVPLMRPVLAFAFVLGLIGVQPAATGATMTAGPLPDFGQQWCSVGDPGNRPVNQRENLNDPPNRDVGTVNYEYRIAKTEVTNAQYIEFVRAYVGYHMETRPGLGASRLLTGQEIDNVIGDPSDGGNYYVKGNPNAPATMGWEFAARYCNWLHNGKRPDRAAFENGVYDTSTFTINPDGSANHQRARSSSATVWIPSVDEWVKAAYWDPAKSNPDGTIGGYWRFAGSRDFLITAGTPESGGMTNRGLWFVPPLGTVGSDSVGQYQGAASPWGLLDTSGGVSEMTESSVNPERNSSRIVMGSAFKYTGISASFDTIGEAFRPGIPANSGGFVGLRLASIVPTPSGAAAAGVGIFLIVGRRRRERELSQSVIHHSGPCRGIFDRRGQRGHLR